MNNNRFYYLPQKIPYFTNWIFLYKLANKYDINSLYVCIEGNISDSNKCENGKLVVTSKILSIDVNNQIITTENGKYKLKNMNSNSKKYYENNMQVLLNMKLIL